MFVVDNNPMAGHEVEVPLRWADMDVMQHINNVAILRLLEEARVRFLTERVRRPGAGMPLLAARHEIDYLAPLLYSAEPARIVLRVPRIGRSGFDLGCEVFGADGTLAAIAETTLVVVDDAGRPAPIPAELRTVLTELLGDPIPFRRRTEP